MQSRAIAAQIAVPHAETAKILQLLVWGGFVSSRRGTKGGFHLASDPSRITLGEVIDFFLARHPAEPDEDFPVMHALAETMAKSQTKFARMKLSEAAGFRSSGIARKIRSRARQSSPQAMERQSSFREQKRRS
jgi:DNA-binding IscR family transcriptional regulator